MKARFGYWMYGLMVLTMACTSGKNALQKGDFDAAVYKAAERLRNNPGNKEATAVLPKAYELASGKHLRGIEDAQLSSARLKYETIVLHYEKLNQLAAEITSCTACIDLIPSPPRYIRELEGARYRAAEGRVKTGDELLQQGGRVNAKKALMNFQKAQFYVPHFEGVGKRIQEATYLATLKVVVEPVNIHSRLYQLNAFHFNQQVEQFIRQYHKNAFVAFYTPQEARDKHIFPDQVIQLSFEDFQVGQQYVKETVEKLKKDSVIVGYTRNQVPIYQTVRGSLSVFDKKVSSSGILWMQIKEGEQQKIVRQKKMAGTYVWETRWAVFNGDQRVLNPTQLKLTKVKELIPPPPETLFTAFSSPIYAQLTEELFSFYQRY